jgi:hypothetical protein
MLKFLLGTRLGRCLGLSAVAAVLVLGALIAGALWGAHWRADRDAVKVNGLTASLASANAANATNQITIDGLQKAVDTWAADAAAYRKRLDETAQAQARNQAASDAALKAARQALKEAENASPTSRAISNSRVPDGVLVRLCAHARSCPDTHR